MHQKFRESAEEGLRFAQLGPADPLYFFADGGVDDQLAVEAQLRDFVPVFEGACVVVSFGEAGAVHRVLPVLNLQFGHASQSPGVIMLVALIERVSIHIFFVDLVHLNPCLKRRGLADCIPVEEPPELFGDDVLELVELVDELCDFPVEGQHILFKGCDLLPDCPFNAVEVHQAFSAGVAAERDLVPDGDEGGEAVIHHLVLLQVLF